MTSICPHCKEPTDLINGAWVCVGCWKRWPVGPLTPRYERADGLCTRETDGDG